MRGRLGRWWPVLVGLVAFALLFRGAAAPVPDDDPVRDFLFARDCWERGACQSAGAWTTMSGIVQGGTWIQVLAVLQMLGLSALAIQACIIALQALAAAIIAAVADECFSTTAALVAAAVYVVLLGLVDDPAMLWNPSLLALFVTLASAACFLGVRTRRIDLFALASLMAGVAISLHPISSVLVLAVLFFVAAGADRPVLTVLVCLGAAAAPVALTSSESVRQALGFLKNSGRWPVPALAVLVSLIAGAAARRVWPKLSTGQRDLTVAGVLIAPLAIAGAARVAVGGHFAAYYLYPVAPALSGLIAGTWAALARWRRKLAFVLAVGAALSLGTREFPHRQPGDTWSIDDGAGLASAVFRDPSRSWESLWPNLEARHCYTLTALLSLYAPAPVSGARREPWTLQVLEGVRQTDWEFLRGHGFELVQSAPGATFAVRPFASRLVRRDGRACVETPDRERTCWPVTNQTTFSDADYRFVQRSYPEVFSQRFSGPHTVEYRFELGAGTTSTRVGIVADEDCPWNISAIEGATFSGTLPAASVELPPGPGGGQITFRKRYDAETCRRQENAARFPPCVLETRPGEEPVFAIARRSK